MPFDDGGGGGGGSCVVVIVVVFFSDRGAGLLNRRRRRGTAVRREAAAENQTGNTCRHLSAAPADGRHKNIIMFKIKKVTAVRWAGPREREIYRPADG